MQHPNIEWQKHEQGMLILLVFLSLAGLFYVSSSFLFNIIFAAIISVSTYPVFLKIKERFNLNNTHASLLTTISVGFVFVAPITYILTTLSIETYEVYSYFQKILQTVDFSSKESAVNGILAKANISESYIHTVRNLLTTHVDIESVAKTSKSILLFVSQNALGGALSTLFFFVFSLFIMFFLYRDGIIICNNLKAISPLHDYYDELLMREMSRLSGILTLSIISVAFLQGFSFGIIAAFLGLNWLFIGVAIALTSFIPIFGTLIVWLPLGIYLYLTGNEFQGVFVILWGIIVISTIIDNIGRPMIVSYLCKLFQSKDPSLNKEEEDKFNPLDHTLIVVISTLGGMFKFGIIGLFLGPIIAGISITVLEIYRIRLTSMQNTQSLETFSNQIKNTSDLDILLDDANEQSNIDLPDINDLPNPILNSNKDNDEDDIDFSEAFFENNEEVDIKDLDDNELDDISEEDLDKINDEFDNISDDEFQDFDDSEFDLLEDDDRKNKDNK